MNTDKKIIFTGGVFGFFGVALGAFGAHGLKNLLTPELLEVFRTGVLYQLIHSVVILAIGLSGRKEFNVAAIFMSVGIILFSFSLYAYTLSGVKIIAMITPVGGVSFLVGWLLIIIKAVHNKTIS
ncbi:MAG: DUF423 domain-containing protein [Ignavibacteriales bacterium]|nr:MAG: DUF423 domain-containing protein [Ignavibacteriales bacterium]